jgi:hypothetical protein
MLFNRRTAIIAGILYAFTWPVIYWTVFILTDSLFVSLLLLTVYLLLLCYRSDKKRYRCLFAASALWLFLFRPTGVISVAFILLYIMLNTDIKDAVGYLKKKWVVICAIAGILLLAAAAVVVTGKLNPLYTSLRHFIRWILVTVYGNGQMCDVPCYYDYKYTSVKNSDFFDSRILSFILNNWYHILILYGKRIWFFWYFEVYGYPLYKAYTNIVNIFGSAGFIYSIAAGSFKKTSVIPFVMLSIKVFCIIIFMDSALRYKMPVYPFLNILAAYGMDRAFFWCGTGMNRLKAPAIPNRSNAA